MDQWTIEEHIVRRLLILRINWHVIVSHNPTSFGWTSILNTQSEEKLIWGRRDWVLNRQWDEMPPSRLQWWRKKIWEETRWMIMHFRNPKGFLLLFFSSVFLKTTLSRHTNWILSGEIRLSARRSPIHHLIISFLASIHISAMVPRSKERWANGGELDWGSRFVRLLTNQFKGFDLGRKPLLI